jgi:tetratricopeptide (TPR) repeat protein
MPLLRLSAGEAFKNAGKVGSAWPRKPAEQAQRLMPVALPLFTPSFAIDRDQLIFTIGSCFARNIERELIAEGCNVASAGFELSADEPDASSVDSVLNRFVCFSMLNEFRWALAPEQPFPRESLIELRPGRWFDMNNTHDIKPSSLERVIARREKVTAYMRRVAEADVIVMTLGLAEAWFDSRTGCYVNVAPHPSVRQSDPNRYELHLLDYNEITGCLDDLHATIARYGKPGARFLVTVSPVALGSTFTGRDALTANTYSKAVQRAAIEHFTRKHPNVDYFPSFESVTLSDRKFAWREDQAHASDNIVRINVLRMSLAYVKGARAEDEVDAIQRAYGLVEESKALATAGDHLSALARLREAIQLAPREPTLRLHLASFLLDQGQHQEAIAEAIVATSSATAPKHAHFLLGRAYQRAELHESAYAAFHVELKATPLRTALLKQLAVTCERVGKAPEGLEHIEKALAQIDPEDPQWPSFSEIKERLSKGGSPRPRRRSLLRKLTRPFRRAAMALSSGQWKKAGG